VRIHYRWHPLSGQEVEVYRRIQRGDGVLLEVRIADGTLKRVPEWMARQGPCEAMVLAERPVCGLPALRDLRRQLDVWAGEAASGSFPRMDGTEEVR
jgi:hypothetical protein